MCVDPRGLAILASVPAVGPAAWWGKGVVMGPKMGWWEIVGKMRGPVVG